MSDFDGLRRVLNSKAVAACNAAGLAGKLQLPNESFTIPKATTYASFWYKTGGSKQIELGGGKSQEMTVGIFQFDIKSPENKGDGPGLKIADLIRPRFNRKEWMIEPNGHVKMLVANVTTPFDGPRDGHYYVFVEGSFHYYHADPNALPFDA